MCNKQVSRHSEWSSFTSFEHSSSTENQNSSAPMLHCSAAELINLSSFFKFGNLVGING